MAKDLGTYFLRIEFEDGSGYIQTWYTGWRYTHGTMFETKLDAIPIPPLYLSEEQLFENMVYMYTMGSYACDCNRSLFLARAYQREEVKLLDECKHDIKLKRLTAIRPDRTEAVLYPVEEEEAFIVGDDVL